MKIFIVTLFALLSLNTQGQDFAKIQKFSKSILKSLQKDGDLSKYKLSEKVIIDLIDDEIDRMALESGVEDDIIKEAKKAAREELSASSNELVLKSKQNLLNAKVDLSDYTFDKVEFNLENEKASQVISGNINILLHHVSEQKEYKLKLKNCLWIEGKWYLTSPVLFNVQFDRELICECINGREDEECEKAKKEFEAYFEENKEEAMALIEDIMKDCEMSNDKSEEDGAEEAMEEVEEYKEAYEESLLDMFSVIGDYEYTEEEIITAVSNLDDHVPGYCACADQLHNEEITSDCVSDINALRDMINSMEEREKVLYSEIVLRYCQ